MNKRQSWPFRAYVREECRGRRIGVCRPSRSEQPKYTTKERRTLCPFVSFPYVSHPPII